MTWLSGSNSTTSTSGGASCTAASTSKPSAACTLSLPLLPPLLATPLLPLSPPDGTPRRLLLPLQFLHVKSHVPLLQAVLQLRPAAPAACFMLLLGLVLDGDPFPAAVHGDDAR